MDITIPILASKISDAQLQAWWESAPPLPAGLEPAEFFAKTLLAAYNAQLAVNTELAVGIRVDAYPAPSSSTPSVGTSGLITSLTTFTVRVRSPLDLDTAIAPLI